MADTVFLIHGMWGGPFYWEPFRSVLEARGWRCIAATLPFHDVDPQSAPENRDHSLVGTAFKARWNNASVRDHASRAAASS